MLKMSFKTKKLLLDIIKHVSCVLGLMRTRFVPEESVPDIPLDAEAGSALKYDSSSKNNQFMIFLTLFILGFEVYAM